MPQNQLKYNPKYPQSSTGKTCSPLLCYRFVSTTLTAQIPAETLSQSHRLCFMQRQAFATSELRVKKNTEGYREYKNPLHPSIISIPFYSFRKSVAKHFLEVAIYLLRGNNLV